MTKYLALSILLITAISCNSVKIVSDNLNNKERVIIGTYNVEGECEEVPQEIQKIRVENSIHQFMLKNGFKRSNTPDFLVHFLIKEEQEAYLAQDCDFYDRWLYGSECSFKVIKYDKGSIVIDIIETANQSIIWHGAIYSPPFEKISNPDKKIRSYVTDLLKSSLIEPK